MMWSPLANTFIEIAYILIKRKQIEQYNIKHLYQRMFIINCLYIPNLGRKHLDVEWPLIWNNLFTSKFAPELQQGSFVVKNETYPTNEQLRKYDVASKKSVCKDCCSIDNVDHRMSACNSSKNRYMASTSTYNCSHH